MPTWRTAGTPRLHFESAQDGLHRLTINVEACLISALPNFRGDVTRACSTWARAPRTSTDDRRATGQQLVAAREVDRCLARR